MFQWCDQKKQKLGAILIFTPDHGISFLKCPPDHLWSKDKEVPVM